MSVAGPSHSDIAPGTTPHAREDSGQLKPWLVPSEIRRTQRSFTYFIISLRSTHMHGATM